MKKSTKIIASVAIAVVLVAGIVTISLFKDVEPSTPTTSLSVPSTTLLVQQPVESESLSILNHSCAHLLAQAVKHLYPNAKFWVGPVIESGFYYDIDLGDEVIKEEDLVKIEKEMKKISKDGKRIVRREISKDEALDMFKDDPYKIDLISRMDESEQVISCYSQGDFTDLCRGGHVDTLKECKNFKLIKFSGAFCLITGIFSAQFSIKD